MAYVYLHKKDNGSIFYVGKGNNHRAWQKNNRSKYWNRIKNKYGLNVVIFKDNMTEEDAFSLERELISAIGLENLTNHTTGGEGILGFKHSKETKRKIGNANRGNSSWSKGIKLSENHKRKISKANKGKEKSKEHRLNISKAQIGKPSNHSSRVYDEKENKYYISISQYCREKNLNYSSVFANIKGVTKINKYKYLKIVKNE